MAETDFYTVTVPPMMKTLTALSGILDKAVSHAEGKQLEWHPKGLQEEALLSSRLISDQFPFLRQVQVACDNAKGGAARIAGIEAPKFEDNEKTIAELKQRIDKTVAFLKTIKPEQIAGQEEREVTLPHWNKKMKASAYVMTYLIPNFYFHVATAYSILRSNGVQLGKADYIGPMPFID
ncbi:MAG TPA: DUF1993 domain-containing protein [Candidatus Paceibacterota bacterium]|jgi:hypothetical protein|nr:DUF1993 domain-containing protein [Candidatus Paceibacterota bacterium]